MGLSFVATLSERPTNQATVRDRRCRIGRLIAIFVALLHMLMAVTAVNTKSPTFDEPQHLAAGLSFWKTNDYRLDPENGTLTGRWAALPLVFSGAKFVSLNDDVWQHADDGGVAHKFLYELGNDPDHMMAQARLVMSLFGAALCLLVYRVTREFFGVTGALIAETFLAFDPNFLAHSALITSDVAASFFFTATIWTCWRLIQKISLNNLILAATGLSGLFLTKFSAPIVLPVLVVISILQISSPAELAIHLGRFQTTVSGVHKKLVAVSATWLV